ncbi:MAG TPA: glycosyltransferase family 4 protein [Chitinispirillaceae bacterium]|jgi:glycosyltransferase involved in cell wall biosynthesis|nr:glycosyltransferase family 4 protein [Chitinispirillaceae bacterium]
MRIAMLSWESLHSVSLGGVAVHVTELAAALERKGHEVHVFTRMRWAGDWMYDRIHGVHYHRVPYTGAHDIVDDVNNMCRAFVDAVFHQEAYMGAGFDIVHAHDWMSSNAMVWIKQGRGRKGIITMHSTEYGRCGNNFYGGSSQRIMDHERHGTYCADKVITVSQLLKNEIQWIYNVPDWKACVVPNGISYHSFDGWIDPGQIKGKYGIGPVDPTVLFVGRMTSQKGPDLLARAIPYVLRYYPNAKFIFTGEGDMKGGVEHMARCMGVAHACRFYGVFPRGDLIDLYRACDCVAVPSRNEPFGIVVLEAWAAGKPVIATHNGTEFVWHNVNGFKVYPNPESIAWGIGSLFANFEHARWMGSKGREAVENSFSWDTIADQTLGVYNS